MEIVVSALSLDIPGGMQTYITTVAPQLERLGHEVTIYAPDLGIMADVARERGMRVTHWEHELPEHCDAVIAQEGVTLLSMLDHYPGAAAAIVVHSTEYDLHLPPKASPAAVVMNDVVQRRVKAMALPTVVHRLRQPIDTDRHLPGAPLGDRPRRVLMLGNYLHGEYKKALVEACEEAGLEWRHVGLHGELLADPIPAITDADIVIGQGRSVLDAMACGRAVWIYGPIAGDGWVTKDNYDLLEADGFRGRATEEVVDAAAFGEDLKHYSSAMGAINRNLVILHHSAYAHAIGLVELLRGEGARDAPVPPLREVARIVRTQYEAQSGLAAAAKELQHTKEQLNVLSRAHEAMTADRNRLREEHARMTEELEAERQHLAALVESRRWHAMSTILRPIDGFRRRSGRR